MYICAVNGYNKNVAFIFLKLTKKDCRLPRLQSIGYLIFLLPQSKILVAVKLNLANAADTSISEGALRARTILLQVGTTKVESQKCPSARVY